MLQATPAGEAAATRGARAFGLALLTLAYVCNYMDRQVMAIVLQPMKLDLGLTDAQLGALTGFAFAATYSVLALPLARLADRWACAPVIGWTLLVFSGFTALCGGVTSGLQLLLCRLGVAVGEAGTNPAAHALISALYPERRRPMALAIYSSGVNLGVILALAVGGLLTQALGWRAAFLWAAVPGLIVGGLSLATLPQLEAGARRGSPVLRATATGFELFRSGPFVHLTIAVALCILAGYANLAWAPTFFIRGHGLDTASAGALLALVSGVGGLLATLAGGWAAGRLGGDPRSRCWLLALVVAGAAPCGVAAFLAGSFGLSAALFCGPALVTGFFLPGAVAQIQDLAPPHLRATASALVMLVANLVGMGLGPTMVGVLSDALAPMPGGGLGPSLALANLAWAGAAFHFWRCGARLPNSPRTGGERAFAPR